MMDQAIAVAKRSRCLLYAILLPVSVQAQSADTSAACIERLAATTRDSDVVQISAHVVPFDTARKLPRAYAAMVAEGLRQYLVLPRPLPTDVYQTWIGTSAIPTVRGVYRVFVHGDGHLSRPTVLGGTRLQAFDDAIVSALVTLDTTGLLPPPDSVSLRSARDSLDVRIRIAPDAVWPIHATTAPPVVEGFVPLVRLHAPVFPVARRAAQMPGNPPPRYPQYLRDARVEGETILEFVVRSDGTPDMESVQVTRATALQFVAAAMRVLPRFRFSPMEVGGCAVATFERMPFQFALTW